MAVAGVGPVVFAQVMGYEMAMLLLVVPLVLDSFASRRIDAVILTGLLLFATAPFGPMLAAGRRLAANPDPNWLFVPDGPAGPADRLAAVLVSFRSLGAALLAAVILIRGWPRRAESQ